MRRGWGGIGPRGPLLGGPAGKRGGRGGCYPGAPMRLMEPLASIPEIAPVFPLPNVVFFPRTILPLHIFEPRYRQMIADTERSAGYIAMALMRPGSENDEQGRSAYFEIGSLASAT